MRLPQQKRKSKKGNNLAFSTLIKAYEKDLYKVAIAIALRVNFNPNDLKLITAIIVIIALASNNGIFKFKNKKIKREGRESAENQRYV